MDGDVEAVWRRVVAHRLVRESDRRSPYPPPPRGNPLLATRDRDLITVRHWRPRMSRERLRLELRTSPSNQSGRTRVDAVIRSREAGLAPWRQRDEFIEDAATYGVYAATAGVVAISLVTVGALLWTWILIGAIALPLLMFKQLIGGTFVDVASGRAHRREKQNPPWAVPSLTPRKTQAELDHANHEGLVPVRRSIARQPDPRELFGQLLADLELR